MSDQDQNFSPSGLPRIKFKEKFSYGLGDVANNSVWAVIGGYLSFYYTNAVGIAAVSVGMIFLIARIFDAFVDIIVGILVDRTKSKHGKARPWLRWMAVPFFIATLLVFAVPSTLSPIAKVIFAFITYNVFNIVYSSINLPYSVVAGLITDNLRDRASLGLFRTIGSFTMQIAVSVAILPILNAVGGKRGSANPVAWTIVLGIISLIAVFLYFICFLGTRERVKPVDKTGVPLKKAFSALIRNKNWFIFSIVMILLNISSGLLGVNVYYAKYIVGNENFVSIMSLLLFLPGFIGMFFMQPIVTKLGKRNSLFLMVFVSLLGKVIIMVGQGNIIFLIIGLFISGLSLAAFFVTWAMMSDVVDYGEWKFGVRTDGIVYSVISFAQKVGSGLGAALIGFILAMGHFNPTQTVQNAQASLAVNTLFLYIPIGLIIVTAIFLLLYDIDKHLPQMQKDLEARHKLSETAEVGVEN